MSNAISVPECTDNDIRAIFATFSLQGLRRLEGALRNGNIARKVFHAGGNRGCLLFHLDNAIDYLIAYENRFKADHTAYAATQRLITDWDNEILTVDRVRRLLADAIFAAAMAA